MPEHHFVIQIAFGLVVAASLLLALRSYLALRRLRSRISPEDKQLLSAYQKALKQSPEAADRLLNAYLEAESARDDHRRAELRARARSDRAAAMELQALLLEDLATHRFARDQMAKVPGPGTEKGLADIDRAAIDTTRELDELKTLCLSRGWIHS